MGMYHSGKISSFIQSIGLDNSLRSQIVAKFVNVATEYNEETNEDDRSIRLSSAINESVLYTEEEDLAAEQDSPIEGK